MSIKDCQEGDQRVTEVDNKGASMNHMPDLWKSDVADADVSRRTQRTTKLNEKGLQYRLELLKERRKNHGKLLRKSSMIDEMTYSWVNATAIREEMDQLNDTIKLFMSAHEEYQSLLTDEEQAADSEWNDQFNEVFSFKHKMVKWLKEAELNNEDVKSRMSSKSGSSRSCKSGSSRSSSKSENSRGSKVSMEERSIEENIRLAEVIAETNYADQKMRMEYDRKKLEMEERVVKAKARARAKVLSTFGDVSLQRYKKEDQLLTGEDNRKNKKTPILRKDPVFHKNETKTEDQKFIHQSRLNYDCKESIPGKKFFSDDLSESSNHELNKNYQSDEVSKMLC